MDDTTDLLKIKIERAKRGLSLDTVNAIDAVDWRASILLLRSKYGYTFEQLGDLEIETELLLCGLISPEDYPKELANRMKITKSSANELVNEMNTLVFRKIQEEIIKNAERKKIFQKKEAPKNPPLEEYSVSKTEGGGQIIPPRLPATQEEANKPPTPPTQTIQTEKLELKGQEVHPILTQKLSGSFQTPTVKTEHTLDNLTPSSKPNTAPKVDPYRMPVE